MDVDPGKTRPLQYDEDNQSPFTSRHSSLALPTPNTLGDFSFRKKNSSSSGSALQAPSSESSKSTNKNVPPTKDAYGFHELTDPALTVAIRSHQALAGDFPVDVVAIHGLTGGYESTWLDGDSGVVWLRDLLPTDMPGARIFSHGYNAEIFNSLSTGKVESFATQMLGHIQAALEQQHTPPDAKVRKLHSLCCEGADSLLEISTYHLRLPQHGRHCG